MKEKRKTRKKGKREKKIGRRGEDSFGGRRAFGVAEWKTRGETCEANETIDEKKCFERFYARVRVRLRVDVSAFGCECVCLYITYFRICT